MATTSFLLVLLFCPLTLVSGLFVLFLDAGFAVETRSKPFGQRLQLLAYPHQPLIHRPAFFRCASSSLLLTTCYYCHHCLWLSACQSNSLSSLVRLLFLSRRRAYLAHPSTRPPACLKLSRLTPLKPTCSHDRAFHPGQRIRSHRDAPRSQQQYLNHSTSAV